MGHADSKNAEFIPLKIAIMTISDSRTDENDTSGNTLITRLENAGHQLAEKLIVPDDRYQIRAVLSGWIADPEVQAVITTGGTGLTGRDITPEAVTPLFDKNIEGFGELFRSLSYKLIKTSTVQSRALAGLANGTPVFCLPGSPGACKDGWDGIIEDQLDMRHKPCNLVEMMPRFLEV
ncbi:MAG: molybdenum cofactor biosynthesis protein B [Gammaproteobacteria bacterium]|jgi:molybdenum cofactor biosynthesis protein B|nr:molybdenum cofactor biosynthesis protein B [Gammaproteobacteria bacterium]MBT3723737.1 molybdenum cofactor biosynthesis protein B [Gammaproteobacteria bacterium]MBT4077209.1 molybdenum cofactor biosynthesis protein B [Gammaproteobacteria bacterium]MBT4192930.1 molybdenum cofactor biosynthesis protein B [Gammaproteobacteria bacterium]MBT4450528.1 molybdenum cofactor biosynthesis protein B [Gammaproteobacteria bacterium]